MIQYLVSFIGLSLIGTELGSVRASPSCLIEVGLLIYGMSARSVNDGPISSWLWWRFVRSDLVA